MARDRRGTVAIAVNARYRRTVPMIMRPSLPAALSVAVLAACGPSPKPTAPPAPPASRPTDGAAIGACVATAESDTPAALPGCVIRDAAGALHVGAKVGMHEDSHALHVVVEPLAASVRTTGEISPNRR